MNCILCFCVIWLVCATTVLPATIPSDANSVAAQTPESSQGQDLNSNAKKLASGGRTSDTIEIPPMENSLPVQEESDPSQQAYLEKTYQNPLHQETHHRFDENHKQLPMYLQSTKLNSQQIPPRTAMHDRQIESEHVTTAASMHHHNQPSISQPAISEPALSNGEQTSLTGDRDWKTGLLNALETSAHSKSDEKESRVQSQSTGALDQLEKESVGSSKRPQSTPMTAFPNDHTHDTEETAGSTASSKDQKDDRSKPTKPTPSTIDPTHLLSTQQSQPAAAAPSSSGHDAETKV